MKKISTHQLKKQFESKYPTSGLKVINALTHLIDFKVWGEYRQGSGKHVNTHVNLSRGYGKKLAKYRLYNHFIHNDCPFFIFYTSKGLVLDGRRYLMLCIDIDNKQGDANDVVQLRSHIENMLNIKTFCNPSTHGNGLHMFFTVSFDKYTKYSDINLKISELNTRIKNGILNKSFKSKFDKICGTVSDVANLHLGTLVKLPNPTDDVQMTSLFESMSVSNRIEDLLAQQSNNNTTHILPNTPCEEVFSEKVKVKNIKSSKKKQTNTLDDIRGIVEPIERRRTYAFYMGYLLGRMPTHRELMDGYQKDVDTGEVSSKRAANFHEILEYMAANFDATKCCGWDAAYAKAKSVVAKRNITQTICDEKYGKKANDSRLKVDDVAVVLALYMTRREGTIKLNTITGKCAFKRSQALKREGKIKRTIDTKKFGASKAILEEFGIICEVAKPVKGVHATAYVVVDDANTLPEPITAVPSHSKDEGVVSEGVEALNARIEQLVQVECHITMRGKCHTPFLLPVNVQNLPPRCEQEYSVSNQQSHASSLEHTHTGI